jgi:Ca-activated chloride channel family protein
VGAAVNRPWALRIGLAAGLLLAAGAIVTAQQVFRSSTDTVLLSVSVTDEANHPITGLTQKDFQIFEDGSRQEISVFASDPQPIALSLLLDSSASMESKLGVVQEAASNFAHRLGPRDVGQVIDFNTRTQIRQPFTSDVAALEHAIHQIRAGGSTSLYDAIYIALTELGRIRSDTPASTIRRQAIILLSDGQDTNSLNKFDDVADLAKRSNVTIYAIGLEDKASDARRSFNEADFALRTLAQITGGRAFFVKDIGQLSGTYGEIAQELANQYVIGYVSNNTVQDGSWRQVSVRVDRAGATARTKTGYFARGRQHSAS